jgi:carbonic anhydrase/acetyltransferase-like protein (isoleucine patch superfamily)
MLGLHHNTAPHNEAFAMALYELDGKRVTTPGAGKYWVADNAIVIGNVTLEEDASIWFGCTVRGDNEAIRIGARSNVQDGCVLHTDPGFPIHIGADCTIGHMVMLHGCTIGPGALIGIGAIILNGAKIGAGALVGAGAMVGEGKEIPPNSLAVGSPAKVIRELTPEHLERMRRGTAHYVKNWQRFQSHLKRQEA